MVPSSRQRHEEFTDDHQDISGFTGMTEKFGKLGPRGSETVCLFDGSSCCSKAHQVRDILSNFFTQLVEIIERYGGDVMKVCGMPLH